MRIKNRIHPSGVCVDDRERNIFFIRFYFVHVDHSHHIFSSLSRVFDNAK